MTELSLHILDIAGNSTAAGAKCVRITLSETGQWTELSVEDDGCGMAPEMLVRVTDPFTTTRTTRPVGLGIPLLKASCEQTGGALTLTSTPGSGTSLTARYGRNHIDTPPLGDLPGTVAAMIQGSPAVRWIITHIRDDKSFVLDTCELQSVLGDDVPLDTPEVLAWLAEYVKESEMQL